MKNKTAVDIVKDFLVQLEEIEDHPKTNELKNTLELILIVEIKLHSQNTLYKFIRLLNI